MEPVKEHDIGGWLLLLCGVLLFWQPLNLAIAAAGAINALTIRGLPLVLVLGLRMAATAFGVAAGLSLLRRRDSAVAMAKAALVVAAATDLFVYLTPYFPNNRMPGDTPIYVTVSVVFYGAWLLYLNHSRRVRQTFST